MASDLTRRPSVDTALVEQAIALLLHAIGEDPARAGLRDTPARVARWWQEFIDHDPGNVTTAFENEGIDQMVCVSGMRVWSLCEHHLLPFWCDVTVAYIPGARVLGLSKIGRIARKHGHRLQLQERLVQAIADDVEHLSGSEHVAVVASGMHLCMSMRGVQLPATMTSSVLRGAFRHDPSVRAELFALARTPRHG